MKNTQTKIKLNETNNSVFVNIPKILYLKIIDKLVIKSKKMLLTEQIKYNLVYLLKQISCVI
jgi:hypothetical protein